MVKAKDNQEYLNKLRHSCAHILAAAVLDLYPKAKLAIGPSIEDGFYYDIDFNKSPRSKVQGPKYEIGEKDLERIEERMRRLVKDWEKFERVEVSAKEARKRFGDNPYKIELIDEFEKKGEKITLYQSGGFVDLCRGGHVDSPKKELRHFKLLSIAGAYWRGDEKNPMLTRIYGTAWPSKKELDKYLWQLEEAKKRDHRKIGKELELFTFADEVGPGLVLWLPKGEIIKEELEKWATETEKEWGYLRVRTPHLGKKILYETSSHLPYYAKEMFAPLVDEEGEVYYLKPMNCPHHHMIYKSKIRSYKDLPLRLAEYGEVYRYERSGELHGLLRVRFITQNDAHIYCTKEQAKDEFKKVIALHRYYYETLGLKDYYMELALRDPTNKEKYHGDEKMWRKAETLTRQAMVESGLPFVEKEGKASFYGPKVDFNIKAVTGKEFGASTNQLDLYMGKRFALKYISPKGKEQVPVIIHRAPLGSSERFIGFLIEHFAGAFPVWLSPVQVVIIPVSQKQSSYAERIEAQLKSEAFEIRVETDKTGETLEKKIRNAQLERIPYMLIVGEKEEKSKKASLRLRTGENLGELAVKKVLERIKEKIAKRSLKL